MNGYVYNWQKMTQTHTADEFDDLAEEVDMLYERIAKLERSAKMQRDFNRSQVFFGAVVMLVLLVMMFVGR